MATSRSAPAAVGERERQGSLALDQWRGLALVLVLVSHGFYFTQRADGIGRVGVNLFFFISGILVYRSLARSRAESRLATARSFWWRRLRRLYPALIAYAVAGLFFAWAGQGRPGVPPPADFASYLAYLPLALFYGMNYTVAEPPMSLGHLWSLACEMQFYVVAPLIYFAGGSTATRRIGVFGGLLAVFLVLGAAQPLIGKWKYHFEFAVWPMMLGFFCEFQKSRLERMALNWVRALFWLAVVLCSVVLGLMPFGVGSKPLVIGVGALLLAPCLFSYLHGWAWAGWGGRAVAWLGERTYSIYLWQQPFTICHYLPALWHPFGAMVSVAVGGVWFRWFERPFLSGSRKQANSTAP